MGAKGGLFRSGAMNKGEGVPKSWAGHPVFSRLVRVDDDGELYSVSAFRYGARKTVLIRTDKTYVVKAQRREKGELYNQVLFVKRMPTFYETFPIIFDDAAGSFVADIPFRRAESRFSVEQLGVTCTLYGVKSSGEQRGEV